MLYYEGSQYKSRMLSTLMFFTDPNRWNLGNKLIYNLAVYCSGKLDGLIFEGNAL